jgi:GLPGLI family protein
MRKLYALLLLIAIHSSMQAQQNGYKITYRHCVQTDTTKTLTDTIGIAAELTGNQLSSNYTYGRQKNPPSGNDSAFAPQQISEGAFTITNVRRLGSPTDAIGNMVFHDKASDSVFVRDKVSSGYVIVREKRPMVNWKVTNEKKMIKNLNCQKASAMFRGRTYTAWFTTELPIAEGPWKFKGLPGLILSIEDDKKQVKIYAETIEYPLQEQIPSFVAKGREITQAAYITIRNEETKKLLQQLRNDHAAEPNLRQSQFSISSDIQIKGFFGIEKSLD